MQGDLKDLVTVMESAGFPLRKWASNVNRILADVSAQERLINYPVAMADGTKTLGIWWDVVHDEFCFHIPSDRSCR